MKNNTIIFEIISGDKILMSAEDNLQNTDEVFPILQSFLDAYELFKGIKPNILAKKILNEKYEKTETSISKIRKEKDTLPFNVIMDIKNETLDINFFLWDIEDYIVSDDKGLKGHLPFKDFTNIPFEEFENFRNAVEEASKFIKLENNIYIQKIDENYFENDED